MKKIMARYNAGRWIVECPLHGEAGAVLAQPPSVYHDSNYWTENNEYICPVCYPQILAMLQKMQNGRIINVPDVSARATARLLARVKEEIFQVEFPTEKGQIETILKERPVTMRNWDGEHETLKMLIDENKIVHEIVNEEAYQKKKHIINAPFER